MMHKAWRSIEEVPYCFLWSSIKFQVHTGWKIDDFNPIRVRLLGRSQLSNHSDVPCYVISDIMKSRWREIVCENRSSFPLASRTTADLPIKFYRDSTNLNISLATCILRGINGLDISPSEANRGQQLPYSFIKQRHTSKQVKILMSVLCAWVHCSSRKQICIILLWGHAGAPFIERITFNPWVDK